MPKFYEVMCDGESVFYATKKEAMHEAKRIAECPGYCRVTVDRIHLGRFSKELVLSILNTQGYVRQRDSILELEERFSHEEE